MQDSLHRNSVYLLLSSILTALLGFIFWTIAAHKYSPYEVGIVTSIIAIAAFIIELSQIGLVNGLIRFMNSFKNKDRLMNTVFAIVSSLAAATSIIFLITSPSIYPKANYISKDIFPSIIFIIYVLGCSYGGIIDGLFVAFRKTQHSLTRNVTASLVKIIAILVIGDGLLGLFYSITLSVIVGTLLGLILLIIKCGYQPSLKLSSEVLKMSRFSIINYVSSCTATLVLALIPLIIIKSMGASDAAFYYIAFSVVSLLNFIPKSTTQSFFAESSKNESSILPNLKRSAKFMLLILLPSALFVFIFGKYILLIFGEQYSQGGLTCLRLLTVTAVLSVINYFGDSILNIQKRLRMYAFTNIFSATTTIIFMLPLLRFGLTSVGLGWLLSEIATAAIYIYIFRAQLLNWRASS